ncbi:MAG: class I SAM-dependent methyltransferase [Lacisediminihabitans sp.]
MTSIEPEPNASTLGARTFQVSGSAYDSFMGRYSQPLAAAFAAAAEITTGMSALDVGCGPGALTGVLVDRLGSDAVSACDPSDTFVAECIARHPGVDIRPGRAEAIPFEDDSFDAVLAQLVLHFVSDAAHAAEEFRRVLRPSGTVAVCVWDFAEGMQMLRHFWDAALTVDPDAPDEARTLRFSREGEITQLFEAAGFQSLSETTLTVTSAYTGFEQLWSGFLAGIGPAGAYCLGLPEQTRAELRSIMFRGLGSPSAPFTLEAVARCVVGRAPN